MPVKELLDNRECRNIVLLWDGGTDAQGLIKEGEHPFDNRKGEDILVTAAEGKNRRLNGMYRQNEGNYSYTSYEFFRGDTMWEVFLGVEDRAGRGEEYFDMLRVPQERLPDIMELDGHRISLADVNFDGHEDLVFLGWNDGMNLYWQSVVWLWEKNTGRFELCGTAPSCFDRVDAEKKRLTNTETNGIHEEDYYIYEYHDGAFREKHLEVRYTDYGDVIWGYYEEGELLERLYLSGKGDDRHYIYHGKGGEMEVSKAPEDVRFDDIGKEFFPEFDFYFFG